MYMRSGWRRISNPRVKLDCVVKARRAQFDGGKLRSRFFAPTAQKFASAEAEVKPLADGEYCNISF